jgi:hypothetical protein
MPVSHVGGGPLSRAVGRLEDRSVQGREALDQAYESHSAWLRDVITLAKRRCVTDQRL